MLDKIKSIKFSLLKKESTVDKLNKAEYSKKKSVTFIIPLDFKLTEEILKQFCNTMYNDLMIDAPDDIDYLGLWIEYESITIDNAISLQTLDDIQETSVQHTDSVYEFFKMTLPNES